MEKHDVSTLYVRKWWRDDTMLWSRVAVVHTRALVYFEVSWLCTTAGQEDELCRRQSLKAALLRYQKTTTPCEKQQKAASSAKTDFWYLRILFLITS